MDGSLALSEEEPKNTTNRRQQALSSSKIKATPTNEPAQIPPPHTHLVPENHRVDQVGQPQRELPHEPFVLESVVQQLVRDVEHLEDQPGALLGNRHHSAPRRSSSSGGRRKRKHPTAADAAAARPPPVTAPACNGAAAAAARRAPGARDDCSGGAVPPNAADGGPWLPGRYHGGVEAVQGSLENDQAGFLGSSACIYASNPAIAAELVTVTAHARSFCF